MPAAAGTELFLIPTAEVAAGLERAQASLGLLSSGEDAFPDDRRLSRIGLRLVLLSRGERRAAGGALTIEPGGRPRLEGSPLGFSLAHAAGLTLIAITREQPVGVDLEAERSLGLSPDRALRIRAAATAMGVELPAGEPAATLQAWTALEAYGKADGRGVGAVLTATGIWGPGSRTRSLDEIESAARALRSTSGLRVMALRLGPQLWAALCIAEPVVVACAPSIVRLEPVALETMIEVARSSG